MTLGISDAMTLYSAAWVPLHMTLAAPVAVERTTASSRDRPFSSARARAATTLSPAPTVLPTGTRSPSARMLRWRVT